MIRNKSKTVALFFSALGLAFIFLWGALEAKTEAPAFQYRFLIFLEWGWIQALALLALGILVHFLTITLFTNLTTARHKWKLLFVLVSLLLIGILQIYKAPKGHRIFYDEDIYIQIAHHASKTHELAMPQDVRQSGNTYKATSVFFNKQPNAWPVLIRFFMPFFQSKEAAPYFLNNLFFVLTPVLLFLLLLPYMSIEAATAGALSWYFFPQNAVWANTASSEISTQFFFLFSLVFLFKNTPLRSKNVAITSALLLGFSFYFRPESFLNVFSALSILLFSYPLKNLSIKSIKDGKHENLFIFFVFLFILSIPEIWHILSVSSHSWGSTQGSKLSFLHFNYNLKTNTDYFLKGIDSRYAPWFISALALIGLGTGMIRMRILAIPFVTSFLCNFGIFLFFYAGSYNYGMDMRFAVLAHAPIGVFIGVFFNEFQKLNFLKVLNQFYLVLIALTSALVFFSVNLNWKDSESKNRGAWSPALDHLAMEESLEKIPEHSYIFSHNPNFYTPKGVSAGQIDLLYTQPDILNELKPDYGERVFIYLGYWCQTASNKEKEYCSSLEAKYGGELIYEKKEKSTHYKLLRLKI